MEPDSVRGGFSFSSADDVFTEFMRAGAATRTGTGDIESLFGGDTTRPPPPGYGIDDFRRLGSNQTNSGRLYEDEEALVSRHLPPPSRRRRPLSPVPMARTDARYGVLEPRSHPPRIPPPRSPSPVERTGARSSNLQPRPNTVYTNDRQAPELRLKPRPEATLSSRTFIHATISKDHTEGESARQADLFAALGQRLQGSQSKEPSFMRTETASPSDHLHEYDGPLTSSHWLHGGRNPMIRARARARSRSRSRERRASNGDYLYDDDDLNIRILSRRNLEPPSSPDLMSGSQVASRDPEVIEHVNTFAPPAHIAEPRPATSATYRPPPGTKMYYQYNSRSWDEEIHSRSNTISEQSRARRDRKLEGARETVRKRQADNKAAEKAAKRAAEEIEARRQALKRQEKAVKERKEFAQAREREEHIAPWSYGEQSELRRERRDLEKVRRRPPRYDEKIGASMRYAANYMEQSKKAAEEKAKADRRLNKEKSERIGREVMRIKRPSRSAIQGEAAVQHAERHLDEDSAASTPTGPAFAVPRNRDIRSYILEGGGSRPMRYTVNDVQYSNVPTSERPKTYGVRKDGKLATRRQRAVTALDYPSPPPPPPPPPPPGSYSVY